jgi:hypothetical protein
MRCGRIFGFKLRWHETTLALAEEKTQNATSALRDLLLASKP